jgi:hypothetical protein
MNHMKPLLIALTITTSLVVSLTVQAESLRDMNIAAEVLRSQLPEAKKELSACLSKASDDYEVDSVYLDDLERVSLKMVKECKKEVYRVAQLKTFVWLHLKSNCEHALPPDLNNYNIWAPVPECELKDAFAIEHF